MVEKSVLHCQILQFALTIMPTKASSNKANNADLKYSTFDHMTIHRNLWIIPDIRSLLVKLVQSKIKISIC